MCHEVSHSLGLPDQYDTNYRALGMSYWSLMDSGNYCNNGKTPCGYTSYERDFLGWRNLEILHESTTVRLKPLEQGGKGYKIVNEKNNDEYYILENRQPVGWDNGLVKLGHGMLAMHVDYL
jgi:M6 family metalloprotease-like protein